MPTYSEFVDGVVGTDPELVRQFPALPRINSDVEILPMAWDCIAIVGTENDVVLRGNQIRGLLGAVLPLLDGTRSVAQVCSSTSFRTEDVRVLIRNLFFGGLLEDRSIETEDTINATARYLGRFSDSTRFYNNRQDVMASLEAGHVSVFGPDGLAVRQMMDDLRDGGVPSSLVADASSIPPDTSLCIGIHASSNTFQVRHFLELAYSKGLETFFLGFGKHSWQLGPLVIPGKSTPYPIRGLEANPTGNGIASTWIAGIATQRILCLLAGVSRNVLTDRFELYTLRNGRLIREHRYLPRWEGHQSLETTGRFLNGVAQPPRKFAAPRHYQHHFVEANVRLVEQPQEGIAGTRPRKVILNASACSGVPKSLQAAVLGRVLRLAFGHHMGRRIAPTGGALGSPEAYLVVVDIPELPGGVYRYRALDHEFDGFVPSPPAVRTILEAGSHRRPQAWLILVGNVGRVASKYGLYGLSIASYDAGIAEHFLRRSCHASGVPVSRVGNVGDRSVLSLLGLPLDGSFVNFGTFALGEDGGKRPQLPIELAVDIGHAEFRCELDDHSVASEAHHQHLSLGDLEALAVGRRSVREWLPRTIEPPVLARLATTLDRTLASYLSQLLGMPSKVAVYLVLSQPSQELIAGVYKWDGGRFIPECEFTKPTPTAFDIVNQQNIGLAPMLLVPVIQMRSMVAERGGRALISALVGSGYAVGRVWLDAQELGLRGVAYGGLIESELRALLPSWREGDVAGLTFAGGYPIDENSHI